MYLQNYNPLGNAVLSTLVAAIPIGVLLYFIALHPYRNWLSAAGTDVFVAALLSRLGLRLTRRQWREAIGLTARRMPDDAGRDGAR